MNPPPDPPPEQRHSQKSARFPAFFSSGEDPEIPVWEREVPLELRETGGGRDLWDPPAPGILWDFTPGRRRTSRGWDNPGMER